MGIEGVSLREVLDGATPDELRGVLLALEGRVVHVGAVTGLLERLRPPATAPAASSSSSSSSSGDSAVVQQPAAALKTSSSDCAVSSPAPATKRARCGDAPDGAGGGGAAAAVAAVAAAANSVGSSAPPPPPAAKDASDAVPTAPDAEMTAPGNSGSTSSGRTAGTDGMTAGSRSEEASSTQGGTAAGSARAAQAPVPPQGPRGLSWREKQRQKAAEKEAGGGSGTKKGRKGKKAAGQQRDFDHSRWRKRTVAVQLMYEGGGYAGFCSQSEGNEETIEKHLFRALTTTKLVENITTGDNYSRCGRTDRGVSALGNVITVSMRSKFPKHVPDADLPTSPLGSLWVAPTTPPPPPPNGADTAGENGGGCTTQNQTMPQGSAAGEQEQPAAGVVDDGSGRPKEKHSEGCPSDSRHPASGDSETCTVAGGGEAGRGEEASANLPGGGGGGSGSVVGGTADAGAAENGGGGGGGGGGLRGSEHERGGGIGGGNNGNGKTKKHKKKSRMGGGSGGGGPPAGGEIAEIDYCGILNRVLPPGVRALAWAPVTEGFSARFSCSDRTYRYFFMARDMDIKAMDEAASKIVGSHDFRNLCKIGT
ncbi:unnamed protein product [Ectocarpus fasciculatus]